MLILEENEVKEAGIGITLAAVDSMVTEFVRCNSDDVIPANDESVLK